MVILPVEEFNNKIATREGHFLYRYGKKYGYIAFEYRDKKNRRGLKSTWGKTKEKALCSFNND